MQAHPPRITAILRGAGVSIICGLSFPLLYLLPAFVYDLLFHIDRLIPNVARVYWNFLSNPKLLLCLAGLGVLGSFSAYFHERAKWKEYQKSLAQPQPDPLPPPERRVEMPEPAATPVTKVVLDGQRSLLGFVAPVAVLIFGGEAGLLIWSQALFRWPPNQTLQWTILGTSITAAILAAMIVWQKLSPRPTVFDDFGISTPARSSRRLILWSEVRHLVLVAVHTPQGKHEARASEIYRIITSDPEPIEFSAAIDNGEDFLALWERENSRLRAAITLAMHRTGLPLIADSEALRLREELLEPSKVRQARRSRYLNAAIVLVGFLAFAGISVRLFPHTNYRQVAGVISSYKWAPSKVTIRLADDSTVYSLVTDGAWPPPPQALPAQTEVTMQVSEQDVGQLDAAIPSGHLRIVTQSYAEPWTAWLNGLLFISFFLVPALMVAIIVGNDIWHRRSLKRRLVLESAAREQH